MVYTHSRPRIWGQYTSSCPVFFWARQGVKGWPYVQYTHDVILYMQNIFCARQGARGGHMCNALMMSFCTYVQYTYNVILYMQKSFLC